LIDYLISAFVDLLIDLFIKKTCFIYMCAGSTGAAKQTGPSKPTTDPTKYNVPEYYQHNSYSFYDLDISMEKHRLPQPSKFDPLVAKN